MINDNSLSENSYNSYLINKKIIDLLKVENLEPLQAFIDIYKEKNTKITVEKVFFYDNKIAGIINDAYLSSMGFYGLWYFYNDNGTWESIGEDIGGETLIESEIQFREKALIMFDNAKK